MSGVVCWVCHGIGRYQSPSSPEVFVSALVLSDRHTRGHLRPLRASVLLKFPRLDTQTLIGPRIIDKGQERRMRSKSLFLFFSRHLVGGPGIWKIISSGWLDLGRCSRVSFPLRRPNGFGIQYFAKEWDLAWTLWKSKSKRNQIERYGLDLTWK